MSFYYYAVPVAIIGGYFLMKRKKTIPPLPLSDTIYMIDQNLDHLTSIFDIISPKANAFDQPYNVCNHIEDIPEDTTIKVVLSTNGGSLMNCEKILKKLLKHKGGHIAYIQKECFSAGTIIALGAKEIVMNNDSYLGKIDPQ